MKSSGRNSSRRRFLQLTGLSVLGLGAKSLLTSVADAARPLYGPDNRALRGTRWAMVVDVKKCPKDCTDCIIACHKGHNVPDIAEPKHEVKWVWTEEYENTFPSQYYQHLPEEIKKSRSWSCAIIAITLRASGSALPGPLSSARTALYSWTFTGVSDAVSAWPPAHTGPAALIGLTRGNILKRLIPVFPPGVWVWSKNVISAPKGWLKAYFPFASRRARTRP